MLRGRRKWLQWLAIALAAIVVLAWAAWQYAPSWLHGAIERRASRALGRELAIDGRFDLELSLTPRITANDVSLANATWGSEPALVRARRVMVVVDLVSLWSRPVRVRELEIDGARLLLERDEAGVGNWRLPLAPRPPRDPAAPPPVVVDRAALRELELAYFAGPAAAPLEVGVDQLTASLDAATRKIHLEGGGRVGDAPWDVAGGIGTLESLVASDDVDHDLTGRLGDARLEVRGRWRDPLALAGPELEFGVEGPDLAATLALFSRRSKVGGAFRLHGRITTEVEGINIEAAGVLGGITVAADASVAGLRALERFEARLEAAGADASEVGAWFGWKGLPARPFELAGRLRRESGRYWLDDADLHVGATSLHAAGELGAAPRFVGTELALSASGRDLSELAALTRLRLPPGPFEVEGRFLRRPDDLAIADAELRFRGARIRASGSLGEPPHCRDLALDVEASGPDLALLSGVLKADLPSRPFTARGGLARDGRALQLADVEGTLGSVAVRGGGRLALAKRLLGSDLQLRLAGPDAGELASLAALDGVPAEPFDLRGRLRVEPDAFSIDGLEGSVGRLTAAGSARIGAPSVRDGTSFAGRVEGEALAALAAWGLPDGLPAAPFAVVGGVRVAAGVYHAEAVVATVGADRVRVDGVLGALPDLAQLDAAVEGSGPSLAGLARHFAAAGFALPRPLPEVAYELAGRVRRLAAGYELRELRALAEGTTVRLDGTIGDGERLRGTDLRFDVDAPDSSFLAALAGVTLPAGALAARGQVDRVDAGFHSDGISLAIGDARAELAGSLGDAPDFRASDLRLSLSVPDLAALLGPIAGPRGLPTEPLELELEVAGDAERLATRSFSARLGDNDLAGQLAARLAGRRFFEADVRSRRLDLSKLLADFGVETKAPRPPEPASPAPRRLLIPDEPLRLPVLNEFDASLRFEAAEVVAPGPARRDVVLVGELRDGAIRVDRFAGSGMLGGQTSASLAIEPVGDGYRIRTRGRLDGGQLIVSKTQGSPESAPRFDLEFELAGEGRTLHEIAASADGHALAIVGPGEIHAEPGLDKASAATREILEALTPFRRTSDHALVECGVALVLLDGGEAEVAPIALRTDKVTVAGLGRVDLDSEALELDWRVKEQLGAGVSTGEISNSYFRLGGTLAAPSLELKTLQAMTSAGAAIASAGLTAVAKVIWNRLTHDKKICERALELARKRLATRAATGGS